MNRVRFVSAISAAMLTAGVTTAAAMTPDLPGSYETPTIAATYKQWGKTGMLIANSKGALMKDGTFRTAAAPATVLPLVTDNLERILSNIDNSVQEVNDRFLVGRSYDNTEQTYKLYSVDLQTGAVVLVDGSDTWVLYGATNTGWVVKKTDASLALRPFNGGADVPLTLPQGGVYPITAGTRGIAFLWKDNAGNAAIRLMAGANLSNNVLIADLGQRLQPNTMGGPALQVVIERTAVAYLLNETGEVGVITGANKYTATLGSDVLPCARTGQMHMTAVPNAVVFHGCEGKVYELAAAGLIDLTLPSDADWPRKFYSWSTQGGVPAFTSLVTTPGVGEAWSRWLIGTTTSTLVQPTPANQAEVYAAVGTNGRVLLTYDVAGGDANTGYIRTLGAIGSTVRLTLPRVAKTDERGFGMSGVWSAIPEWNQAMDSQTLTVRYDTTVKHTISVPDGVDQAAQSGPFTAYTAANGVSKVVGPDGSELVALPDDLYALSLDGTRIAYMKNDKSVWLRDFSKASSATNPKQVKPACDQCYRQVLLSSKWIVVPDSLGNLNVIDFVANTSRVVSGAGTASCTSINGNMLVCKDWFNGNLWSLDLASDTSALASLVIPVNPNIYSLAGHRVVWGSKVDLRTENTSAVKAAKVPTAYDTVGRPRLLGTWPVMTPSIKTGGPAWTPIISVSDSLNTWTITLRDSARNVIKAWTGTAADGDIKNVSWDAKLDNGSAAPVGLYTWTLTGSGPYGAPLAVTGIGAPTGQVRVVAP